MSMRTNTRTAVKYGNVRFEHVVIADLPCLIERLFDGQLQSIPKDVMAAHNREEIEVAQASMNGRDPFYNCHTMERIRSLISEPRMDLLKHVEEYRDRILELMPPDDAPKRRIRRGQEYGDSVDIDRELCGILECWDRSERVRSPQKEVTIAVNLSVSWKKRERDLVARGGLAAAMVEALTSRGVSVRLVATNGTRMQNRENDYTLTEIVLKETDDYIDTASIATSCCDTGFIRGVMYLGGFTYSPCAVRDGWGYPETIRTIKGVTQGEAGDYDFVIDSDIWTPDEAVRRINELIERSKA